MTGMLFCGCTFAADNVDYTTGTPLLDPEILGNVPADERLSAYFSSITCWESEPVNGSTLTGEACADMGGITAVLHFAKTNNNFDYDAFFRAFAKVWFNVEYPEHTQSRIASNPHPILYLRANVTIQQFEEFYETYGIQEGDSMYLSEENRIQVW